MITKNDIDNIVQELLSDYSEDETFVLREVRFLIVSAFIRGSSHELGQQIKKVEAELAALQSTRDLQSMG
jgi:hypothetical protein